MLTHHPKHRDEHRDDFDVPDSLAREQDEVDMFKKEPRRFASVILVMQKISRAGPRAPDSATLQ